VNSRRKTYTANNDRIGWRALCAMFGYAGPRIAETLDLRERDVRLHDPRAPASGSPTAKRPRESAMSRSRRACATSC
jgi:hypothetical protein